MKALNPLLLVSLALTSCDRPASSQTEITALRQELENLKAAQQAKAQPAAVPQAPQEPPQILALPPSPLEASVAPSVLPLPEPTAAKPPRLAPEDVLYLTQRLSIPIEGGITGLPPGTAVTRISQDANGITIQTASGLKAVVQPSKVTNDLDRADEIAANFAKEQQEGALARTKIAEQVAAKDLQAAKEQREKEAAEIKKKQQQSVPYTPNYPYLKRVFRHPNALGNGS